MTEFVINLKHYSGYTYYRGTTLQIHENLYARVGRIDTAKRYSNKKDAQYELFELQHVCVNASEAQVEEVNE